ncbi:MAG TPA: glycosyltransferase family 4 protein [Mucilaginibacter sp.]
MRGVPVLLSPRGTIGRYTFNNRNISAKWLIHHLLGRRLLRKVQFHVTSKKERDSITEIVKPKSITEIPNFVAIPGDLSIKPTRVKDVFRLVFLSRIEEKKGLDLLIKALPLLQIPYSLTIAGDGEPSYIEQLKQLAKSGGIDQNIKWIGFQGENKFDLLAGHDLMILPSHDENFGNVVIESLSVGTAVLVSKFVGLADFVSENELGWVCDPDEKSIADKVNWIYNNREQLNTVRNKAPEFIRSVFNEQRLIEQYIEMYQSIITN